MLKLTIPYPHDPANLQPIYLAVTTLKTPSSGSWVPAFRDTVDGARVIWARFSPRNGSKVNLWLRDGAGDRLVKTVTL